MRVALAGLAALAALAGGVPAAASTVGAGRVSGTPSWAIQATPLPRGATTGYLPSVSCVTPADCVAVGSHFQTSGPRNQLRGGALAEHWTGGAWRLQPVPSPAGPNKFVNLSAVSCDSAASCTAVGNYQNRAGNYFTLAEHWNGSTWSILATPTPPGVAYVNLNAVWCDSAASCVAAGYYAVGVTSGGGAALVERWDGSGWTIEPTPANPPGTYVSILDAVSCTSAASCTAVGASYASTSPTIRPLAERWDGSGWTIQPTPAPSGSTGTVLAGLSCTTATSCTAVGSYSRKPDAGRALAEHWNGSAWTIQPIPAVPGPGDPDGGLYGVSCTTADQCTAVGRAGGTALAEQWDGSTWTVQPTASPASQKLLYAVSCPSAGTCTATGGSTAGTGVPYTFDQPLAEHE